MSLDAYTLLVFAAGVLAGAGVGILLALTRDFIRALRYLVRHLRQTSAFRR